MTEHEWRSYMREKIEAMDRRLIEVQVEIAALKIKSSVWGFAAGLLPAIGVLLVWFITK